MALAQAREIDAVLVTELTRWGRSTEDLMDMLGAAPDLSLGRRRRFIRLSELVGRGGAGIGAPESGRLVGQQGVPVCLHVGAQRKGRYRKEYGELRAERQGQQGELL